MIARVPTLRLALLAGVFGATATMALAAGVGSPLGIRESVATVVGRIPALGFGLAVVVGAMGLGRLARGWVRAGTHRARLEDAIGIALFLTVAHLVGWSAGFGVGRWILLAVLAAGWAGAAMRAVEHARAERGASETPDGTARRWVAPVAGLVIGALAGLVLVAASQPPGSLWDSEFGGFDALAYHLQLPQEWLALGRIRPLDHNVYSYLPSYLESAYAGIGAMTGASGAAGTPAGLLAGSGWRVLACQGMHAGFMVPLGVALVSLARAMSPGERSGWRAWPIAWLVLLTPWVVVVGTLAYNELAMLTLIAGAVLAAMDGGLSPARRGMVAGALVGVACGVKPTALLFGGIPVGVMLLGTTPARSWWRVAGAGAIAGAVTLAPWMVRNAVACGNPVFPALAGVFGQGPWDAEQVSRFAAHHVSREPMLERLRLLVMPDAGDPAGARHRGMLHPQWGGFFVVVFLALGHALAWGRGRDRRLAILASSGLLGQVASWLVATHVQSRFLLPLTIPGAMLVASALGVPSDPSRWFARLGRRAMLGVVVLGVVIQGGFLAHAWTTQRHGRPNALLPFDPSAFSPGGMPIDPDDREALFRAFPQLAVGVEALRVGPEHVYLLGESAPFYYPGGVAYHSVWDRWRFRDGELTDPSIRSVLVNLSEIARFERSGYLPPGVSTEGVRDWMQRRTALVRAWDKAGIYLVRVRE